MSSGTCYGLSHSVIEAALESNLLGHALCGSVSCSFASNSFVSTEMFQCSVLIKTAEDGAFYCPLLGDHVGTNVLVNFQKPYGICVTLFLLL